MSEESENTRAVQAAIDKTDLSAFPLESEITYANVIAFLERTKQQHHRGLTFPELIEYATGLCYSLFLKKHSTEQKSTMSTAWERDDPESHIYRNELGSAKARVTERDDGQWEAKIFYPILDNLEPELQKPFSTREQAQQHCELELRNRKLIP